LAFLVQRIKRKRRMEKINAELLKDTKAEIETKKEIAEAEIVKPATGYPKAQTLKCPSCDKAFKLTEMKRPVTVKCPHCSVKGEIK